MKASITHRVATFVYTDPETRHEDLIVHRIEEPGKPKRFLQGRKVEAGFVFGAPLGLLPIYNRTRIKSADTVLVVEGEKVAHALADVGIIATTSPGGAGKAHLADWQSVAVKTLYLWPDNDPVDPKTGKSKGIDHMRDVARIAQGLPGTRIFWINPEDTGVGPKGDAADFIDAMEGETVESKRASVEALMRGATALGPAGEVRDVLEAEIDGRRASLPWKWSAIQRATQAGQPGDVTIFCGGPGSGKTFLVGEQAGFLHELGIKVAWLVLEDDRAFHLRRVLAQRAGCSELTDTAWVRGNPDTAREIYQEHAAFLDSFGRCIFDAPEKQVPLLSLVEWVQQQAAGGARAIIIDPITAARSFRPALARRCPFPRGS